MAFPLGAPWDTLLVGDDVSCWVSPLCGKILIKSQEHLFLEGRATVAVYFPFLLLMKGPFHWNSRGGNWVVKFIFH